jgi:polyphosphate kinase
VAGLSQNIRVISVVGRFLEHSRIFYFLNGEKNQLYLSSADWMNRNLFRRIEVVFPVLDKNLKKRIMQEGLLPYLKDNLNAWELRSDGQYYRKQPRNPERGMNAQLSLMEKIGA